MADVNFEEQDWQTNIPKDESKQSWLISLVLKTGLVKNENQANYVLLGMAAVFIGLAIYFFASANGGGSNNKTMTVPPQMGAGTIPVAPN